MSGVGFQVAGDLALNADGTDWRLATGRDAARQEIQTGISVFLGSWEYNTAEGLDYRGAFLIKGSLALARSECQAWLLRRTNVVEILSLTTDLNRETRELTMRFRVRLQNGQELSDSVPFLLVPR